MSATELDDETLMALADGELEPARAHAVRQAIAHDASLRRRFDVFVQTRERLQSAYAHVLRELPPQRLAKIGLASRGRFAAPRLLPLAAAVALMFGAGYWLGAHESGGGLLAASSDLKRALSTAADGASVRLHAGASGRIDSTFRTKSGLCRSFQTTGGAAASGVACRENDDWTIRVLAREGASAPAASEYLPASSASPAIDAFLDTVEAGERLTPDEVAQLRANNWR